MLGIRGARALVAAGTAGAVAVLATVAKFQPVSNEIPAGSNSTATPSTEVTATLPESQQTAADGALKGVSAPIVTTAKPPRRAAPAPPAKSKTKVVHKIDNPEKELLRMHRVVFLTGKVDEKQSQ
jgi:hypothetical protein